MPCMHSICLHEQSYCYSGVQQLPRQKLKDTTMWQSCAQQLLHAPVLLPFESALVVVTNASYILSSFA